MLLLIVINKQIAMLTWQPDFKKSTTKAEFRGFYSRNSKAMLQYADLFNLQPAPYLESQPALCFRCPPSFSSFFIYLCILSQNWTSVCTQLLPINAAVLIWPVCRDESLRLCTVMSRHVTLIISEHFQEMTAADYQNY